jgi:hypothetical protein
MAKRTGVRTKEQLAHHRAVCKLRKRILSGRYGNYRNGPHDVIAVNDTELWVVNRRAAGGGVLIGVLEIQDAKTGKRYPA